MIFYHSWALNGALMIFLEKIKTCILFWQWAFTWIYTDSKFSLCAFLRQTLLTWRKWQTCWWSLRSRPVSHVQTQSCIHLLRWFILYDYYRSTQIGYMPETSSPEMLEKHDFNKYITIYGTKFKGKNPSCTYKRKLKNRFRSLHCSKYYRYKL